MPLIFNIYVPDEGPKDAKVIFVGEAPGENEMDQRRPFVGQSGDLLMNAMARAGMDRSEVRLANLSHYRPSSNKFANLIGSRELREGLNELYDYINTHQPNLVVALGAQPLKYLTGKDRIDKWRGSIISTDYPNMVRPVKLIATYHPSAVLREGGLYPPFQADIYRIAGDRNFPELRLPEYNIVIDPQGYELENITDELCNADRLAVDIESTKSTKQILCVGFASTPTDAVVLPFNGVQQQSSVARILSSQAKKIFQFGTFDVSMLGNNGFTTNNYWWDTLVAQHVLNPELPRGLDFLASVYTRQPYYKQQGRASIPGDQKSWGTKVDKNELYVYNGKDCCVTAHIQLEQERELAESNVKHVFDFEMSELDLAREISDNGMPVDDERVKLLETILLHEWARVEFAMEGLIGEKINVKSPKIKDLLYTRFKLPERRNREGGLTVDEDAIVSLIAYVTDYLPVLRTPKSQMEWKIKLAVLKGILEVRGVRQLLSNYIRIKRSDDGRMRSTYKVANTETGRWAAESYIDGTGNNAQTFPRQVLEISDELIERYTHENLSDATLKEFDKLIEEDRSTEQGGQV